MIKTYDDLLKVLDQLLDKKKHQWWDKFFSNRNKVCPFFVEWPDENLVTYINEKWINPGKVLEFGCGHGRNATYLAENGFEVYAIDYSQRAIAWAQERTQKKNLQIGYICSSIFDLSIPSSHFDFIYDCGCFHHIPPHRRITYLQVVRSALKANGFFGLVCFDWETGSKLNDLEVYRQQSLGGGLGYHDHQLKTLFKNDFKFIELRKMREMTDLDKKFGKNFLWTLLAQKKTVSRK